MFFYEYALIVIRLPQQADSLRCYDEIAVFTIFFLKMGTGHTDDMPLFTVLTEDLVIKKSLIYFFVVFR